MTSLNPVMRFGEQISQIILLHRRVWRKDAFKKSIEILNLVKIPSSKRRGHEYPRMTSGGIRQRIMILSYHPTLMIADEPTPALNVTIQAQILYLAEDLEHELGISIILVIYDHYDFVAS